MKFLPACSTYQLDRDRPGNRAEPSRHLFRTVAETFAAASREGESLFKGGYSGLGRVAEINRNKADWDGLRVARPHRDRRSGRYS